MNKMHSNKRLFRQCGMTLIEILVGLTIGGLVIAGALSMSSIATDSNSALSFQKGIMAIASGTRNLYLGQSSYGTNVSLNSVLTASKKIPTDFPVPGGSGSVINTPLGGTVTVTGTGTSFTIAVTNVPASVCTTLLTALYEGWSSVRVGTGTALTSFPVSPADATASGNCGSSGVKTITWTSAN